MFAEARTDAGRRLRPGATEVAAPRSVHRSASRRRSTPGDCIVPTDDGPSRHRRRFRRARRHGPADGPADPGRRVPPDRHVAHADRVAELVAAGASRRPDPGRGRHGLGRGLRHGPGHGRSRGRPRRSGWPPRRRPSRARHLRDGDASAGGHATAGRSLRGARRDPARRAGVRRRDRGARGQPVDHGRRRPGRFRAGPTVLEAMGRTVVHIGPSGAGQVAKACNQLVVGATIAAVAEALPSRTRPASTRRSSARRSPAGSPPVASSTCMAGA